MPVARRFLTFALASLGAACAGGAGRSPAIAAVRMERAGTSAPRAEAPAAPAGAPVRAAIVIEKTDADGDGVPDLEDLCPARRGPRSFQGCPDADGDGIADAEDACPEEPGASEAQGCPLAKDTDRDAVPDDIDRCPIDAEDLDGFQDEDGCPETDDDHDGIVDRSDACPNTPGPMERRGCPAIDRDPDVRDADGRDADGDRVPVPEDRCPERMGPRPDGCPRRATFVDVRPERIALGRPIAFIGAGARLSRSSFPLLDELVQVLTDFPRMRLAIEVHTAAAVDAKAGLRLTRRRADAVRDYLVAKGIAPDRLEAVGLGSTRPIASNKTERGRALNRRLELRVLRVD